MNVLRNPMKSNTNDNNGFTLVPACAPNALVNIPHINERIIKSNAAITPPIRIPMDTLPINCHPLRLLGSLKKSD